jgi:hypothetical protein
MVNKQGVLINNSRSAHYFVTHKDTGENIGKFLTYDKAKDFFNKLQNNTCWKIKIDWVIVKG